MFNYKKALKITAIPVVLTAFLAGCSSDSKEVVGSIKGSDITKQQLVDYMLEMNATSSIKSILQDEIIEKELDRLGIKISKEEKEQAFKDFVAQNGGEEAFEQMLTQYDYTRAQVEQIVYQNTKIEAILAKEMDTSDKVLKEYFEENKSNYVKGATVEAYHILVEKESTAKDIIAQLDKQKSSDKSKVLDKFKELAEKKSTDSASAAEGGYLDYFEAESMVQEFSDAAFSMKKATYSETPVKSQYGYHVIYVSDKKAAEKGSFKSVKEQVKKDYVSANMSEYYTNWLQDKFIEYKAEDKLAKINYADLYTKQKEDAAKAQQQSVTTDESGAEEVTKEDTKDESKDTKEDKE